MNPVKDKLGVPIQEGDIVKYYDSTGMWLEGRIVDVGSCLAILTDENPIRLEEFTFSHTKDYIYDGSPIPELLIVSRNLEMDGEGKIVVRPDASPADALYPPS
jgi:hypothetical protein